MIRIIQAYPPLTNAQRADLNINIRDVDPTPIPPPATQPVVTVLGSAALEASLRISDITTPTRRAKPAGVLGCELWVKVGGDAPLTVDECKYNGLATRANKTLAFATADKGQTAYVLARWINERGEPGPVSTATAFTVAA